MTFDDRPDPAAPNGGGTTFLAGTVKIDGGVAYHSWDSGCVARQRPNGSALGCVHDGV